MDFAEKCKVARITGNKVITGAKLKD